VIDFTKVDAGELNQALISAHDEIVSLRARLAHMEPKADAYDTIARIARLTVQDEARGYSVDVAWRIKSLLEKVKTPAAEEEAETA
jgi:hypothetical protein